MNREWPHCYDPARQSHTINRSARSDESLDLFVIKHTTPMRVRQHPQWTVRHRRVVKMHAKRDHALERPRRGNWCHTTNQLALRDLSNNVARKATGVGPTKRLAISTTR